MRRHALVTGATGGLGRTLVRQLLAADYRVMATGRNIRIGTELAAKGAQFMGADLIADSLESLVDKVDTVFHLAALSSPWGRYADFEAINITATGRLLEAARQAGAKRFIYVSTPSIYAAAHDRLGLTETDPPAMPFANAYAATKYAAEQRVLAAHDMGIATIVLRPRAIVGPHDEVILPRLLRAVKNGRIRLPGGGNALIELTDVRDVCAALIAADRASATGKAFNISGGSPRSLRALLTTIFAVLERPVDMRSIGVGRAMAFARLAEMITKLIPGQPEPAITTYTVKALGYSQTFDLSAARTGLGWTPRFTPEEAIAHALGEGAIHD